MRAHPWYLVLCACALTLVPRVLRADEPRPYAALEGVAVARASAQSWASDAELVWVENDENVDSTGAAARWGYLWYSPSSEKARAYSVRDGRILVAENLEMTFDAPPVTDGWIDSRAAYAAAEKAQGQAFRTTAHGRLRSMVLSRGTMHAGDPDRTTWTVVYAAASGPSLFVVVDAANGKVLRTWRG